MRFIKINPDDDDGSGGRGSKKGKNKNGVSNFYDGQNGIGAGGRGGTILLVEPIQTLKDILNRKN